MCFKCQKLTRSANTYIHLWVDHKGENILFIMKIAKENSVFPKRSFMVFSLIVVYCVDFFFTNNKKKTLFLEIYFNCTVFFLHNYGNNT